MKSASLAEWEEFKSRFTQEELKLFKGNPELDAAIAAGDYIRAQELAIDWVIHQKLLGA